MSGVINWILGSGKDGKDDVDEQNEAMNEVSAPAEGSTSKSESRDEPMPDQDADDSPTADELRKRRLEKFSGAPKHESNNSCESRSPERKTLAVGTNSTAVEKRSAPNAEKNKKQNIPSPSKIDHMAKISLSDESVIPEINTVVTEKSPSAPSVSTQMQKTPSTLVNWEEQLLSSVFRVSLSPRKGFLLLNDLKTALEEENEGEISHMLSRAGADRVLVELLSSDSQKEPLILVLAGIYQNIVAKEKDTSVSRMPDRKEIVSNLKSLVVRYSVLILLYPDLFSQSSGIISQGSTIICTPLIESTLPPGFLGDIIHHAETVDGRDGEANNGLRDMFEPVFTDLSEKMKKITILDAYSSHLSTLMTLLEYKQLQSVFSDSPNLIKKEWSGRQLELKSLFGPYFSLSLYCDQPGGVGPKLFDFVNSELINKDEAESAILSGQSVIHTLHDNLFRIVKTMLGKATRNVMMDWLAFSVQSNEGRAKMHIDKLGTSSDGFMSNVEFVLLKLAQPVFGKKSSKMHAVDPLYLLSTDRLDVSMLTKTAYSTSELNAMICEMAAKTDKAHADAEKAKSEANSEYMCKLPTKSHSFVTEIVHFAMLTFPRALHRQINMYLQLLERLNTIYGSIRQIKAMGGRPPMELAMMERELVVILRHKMSFDVYMLDDGVMVQFLELFSSIAAWLLNLLDPSGFVRKDGVTLSSVPFEFGAIPECVLDGMADFLIHLTRFASHILEMNTVLVSDITGLFAILLGSPKAVKNPFIRSKFLQLFVAIEL